MNIEEIRKKVQKIKSKYKTNNPYVLIDYLNIRLKYFPSSTSSLLGMYTKILNGRFIFLSSELDYKERSIIAHEIGHDQLHRFMMKKNGLTSFNCASYINNRYEKEANIFAAELLISDKSILNMIEDEIPINTFAYENGVIKEFVEIKLENMYKLGLIDININNLLRPASDFLKYHEQVPEPWEIC